MVISRNLKIVLILYLLIMILAGFMIVLYPKGYWVYELNLIHHTYLDWFFVYWTYFGDGLLYLILALVFIFIRFYYFILTVLVALVQTVFVHIFKQWLFDDLPRPAKFFEGIQQLYLIPGVRIHHYDTFPSGHTATAFAIATLISLIIQRRSWSVLLLVTAVLVGISRMYLLQHFLIDIYFGSLIGVISAFLVYYYFEVKQANLIARPFWEKPLVRI